MWCFKKITITLAEGLLYFIFKHWNQTWGSFYLFNGKIFWVLWRILWKKKHNYVLKIFEIVFSLSLVSGRHSVMAPMSTSGSGCLLGYKFMDLGSCCGKRSFLFSRIFLFILLELFLCNFIEFLQFRWHQSTRNCLDFYIRGRWVSFSIL